MALSCCLKCYYNADISIQQVNTLASLSDCTAVLYMLRRNESAYIYACDWYASAEASYIIYCSIEHDISE